MPNPGGRGAARLGKPESGPSSLPASLRAAPSFSRAGFPNRSRGRRCCGNRWLPGERAGKGAASRVHAARPQPERLPWAPARGGGRPGSHVGAPAAQRSPAATTGRPKRFHGDSPAPPWPSRPPSVPGRDFRLRSHPSRHFWPAGGGAQEARGRGLERPCPSLAPVPAVLAAVAHRDPGDVSASRPRPRKACVRAVPAS